MPLLLDLRFQPAIAGRPFKQSLPRNELYPFRPHFSITEEGWLCWTVRNLEIVMDIGRWWKGKLTTAFVLRTTCKSISVPSLRSGRTQTECVLWRKRSFNYWTIRATCVLFKDAVRGSLHGKLIIRSRTKLSRERLAFDGEDDTHVTAINLLEVACYESMSRIKDALISKPYLTDKIWTGWRISIHQTWADIIESIDDGYEHFHHDLSDIFGTCSKLLWMIGGFVEIDNTWTEQVWDLHKDSIHTIMCYWLTKFHQAEHWRTGKVWCGKIFLWSESALWKALFVTYRQTFGVF